MYLYNLTLQKPTAVFQSISGNFSGTKAVEIVLSHGRSLELLKYDENGKIESVLHTEVFGIIRSLIPFRLTGGSKDYIIVGSDSGRVVILEYNPTRNQFDKVHQETFGRTGCRRIVPGQYLAVDPKGRAFMIGAIEKQKLVYILNRDSAAKLTISSPLEAHKSHTIVYSMCGVDVGFENPIFATISVDYSSEDTSDFMDQLEDHQYGGQHKKKMLTFYELDLGLNNVVRKWSDEIDYTSNIVMSVPGGQEGPGGVLVCCENYIVYKNQGQPEKRAKIPRRVGTDPNRGLLIISHSSHKQKSMFFFLVQSEFGDLYKISLDYQGEIVNDVKITYFDTIPPANCLSVLKNGFLFSASEFGDHALYFFQSLGNEGDDLFEKDSTVWFNHREYDQLQNLLLTSTLDSLSPILDFRVLDLVHEETPQIYALCGVSSQSSLKVLRHGISVTQMAATQLPGIPSGIWTVPRSSQDLTDKYIVVSFIGSTLVLSVGETVEEVLDSGILATTTTLLIKPIGEDSIVQIYSHGIRHIKSDKRINEWRAPGRKTIVHATANQAQVVIALSGGELIYFELDGAGNLSEVIKKDMRRDIACIEISPIPKGRSMSRFLAISDWEGPVRVLSLDRENCLGQVSMIDTEKVQIENLAIVEMPVQEAGVDQLPHHLRQLGAGILFLYVGLKNGVMKRATIDGLTGELSDIRTRYLGRKPVKFFKIKVRGSNALLALSSRVWLNYINQGRLEITPLSVESLDNASSFSSDQCAEGIVATSENHLKIFTLEKLGDQFNRVSVPLECTPRRFIVHPQTNYIISIESELNYNTEKIDATEEQVEEQVEVKKEDDDMETDDSKESTTTQLVSKKIYKPKIGGKGRWRSFIKIIDPVSYKTLDRVELDKDEAAFSICTCSFTERDQEILLAVGTSTEKTQSPNQSKSSAINLYKFLDNGTKLSLIYKTEVETTVHALQQFQGRLVAGVGNILRIYDMGKKKLLRKCETKSIPTTIVNIHTQGDRMVIGDVQESFHFVKYKKSENMLYVFADDTSPRYVTASALLDYDTVAGGDKFGNIFVVRLPTTISDEVEEDPTGSKLRFETGLLNGAPHKVEQIISFYLGETVTHLSKTSLVVGGAEVLLYATINGSIGALIPFVSREDVDFFSTLEMHMRQENPPLCGRDHLAYRSFYFPVKNVIDGDLCEQFSSLDPTKQRSIAEELSRTPSEVIKKLEDLRSQKLL
eukprot:gene2352-2902_t